MKSKHEKLDSIIFTDPNSQTDIQYIEHEGTLRREEVSSSSGTVRSSEVFGRFQLPEVGKRFSMVAEPYVKSLPKEEAVRMVSTSVVKRIEYESGGSIYFWTENSKYSLVLKPKN